MCRVALPPVLRPQAKPQTSPDHCQSWLLVHHWPGSGSPCPKQAPGRVPHPDTPQLPTPVRFPVLGRPQGWGPLCTPETRADPTARPGWDGTKHCDILWGLTPAAHGAEGAGTHPRLCDWTCSPGERGRGQGWWWWLIPISLLSWCGGLAERGGESLRGWARLFP